MPSTSTHCTASAACSAVTPSSARSVSCHGDDLRIRPEPVSRTRGTPRAERAVAVVERAPVALRRSSAASTSITTCVWSEDRGHEASERGTRISALAHPRDRAGLHTGGCLGPSRARRRRGLPDAARLSASSDPANADSLPARILWRVRDLLGAGSASAGSRHPVDGGRTSRASCRSPARTKPRWPTGCLTICAARRRICVSTPCPSRPSTAPTSSSPRSSRTRPCTA